jgi:hypothetical protein
MGASAGQNGVRDVRNPPEARMNQMLPRDTTGCPNFPPCGHSALMHDVRGDADGYECKAVDRMSDDRQQRYVEARCPCGRTDR